MTVVEMHPKTAPHASKEKKMKKTREKKVAKASATTITEERRSMIKGKAKSMIKGKAKSMIKGKAKVRKNDEVSVKKSTDIDSSDVKTKEDLHDINHRRTLFMRFPHRVKDKSMVNKLHPGIEAVRFKYRIKSWCHVRFVSEEVAKKALKKLNNMKLEEGGKLIVAETKKAKINEIQNKISKVQNKNKEEDQKEKKLRLFKIFVKDLPESVTKAEIRSAFPNCAKIRILPLNIKKKCQSALVGFRNVDNMKTVVAERIHIVRGKKVHVDYSKSYLNLSNQEDQMNTSSKINPPLVSTKKQNAAVTPKSLGKMIEVSLSQLKKRDNVAKKAKMDTSENIICSDGMGNGSKNKGMNMVDARSKKKEKLRTTNSGNYTKHEDMRNINIGQADESDCESNDTDDNTYNQDTGGSSDDSNDSGDGNDPSDDNDGEGSDDSNDENDDDDDVDSGDNDSNDEGGESEDDGSDEGGESEDDGSDEGGESEDDGSDDGGDEGSDE